MKEPILILSDLHLGHKASVLDDVSMLKPLLAGVGTLLLNGDTWQELAKEFREDGKKLLGELQQACRAHQVDLVLLPGNHDPNSGAVGYATLAEGRIVVTHGDCVYPEGAPWSRMAIKKEAEWQALWAATTVDTIEQRIELGKNIARLLVPPSFGHSRHLLSRVWDAIMPPSRGIRMILSWWHMVAQTRSFARRYFPACEIMVCGHFHRAGLWDHDNLLVVNTGSFMPPGGAYWCEWRERIFTVGKIAQGPQGYTRGEVVGVWNLPVKTKEGGESFGS